jgi:hypothetical protein
MQLFATTFIVLGCSIVQASNDNNLRGGHNELSRRLFYGAWRINPYSYYNPIDLELEQGLINRDRKDIHDVDNLENSVTSGLNRAIDTDSTQATLNMVKGQLDATLRHPTAALSDKSVASDSAPAPAAARVTSQPVARAGVPRTDEVWQKNTAASQPVDQKEYDTLQEQLAEIKLKVQHLEKDKASAAQAKTALPTWTNSDDKSPTEFAGVVGTAAANTHENGKSYALASLPSLNCDNASGEGRTDFCQCTADSQCHSGSQCKFGLCLDT